MSPFLLLAALFPAAALLVRVYRLDKIEKEPPRVLWTLIGCGAAAAPGLLSALQSGGAGAAARLLGF